MRIGVFGLFLLFSFNLIAQDDFKNLSSSLSFYGDVMVSALEADNRSFAAKRFYSSFKEFLDSENAYTKDMAEFRTLSILDAEDGRFRLISWQTENASYEFSYKCFIVFPDGSYSELLDRRRIDDSVEYLSLKAEDWYGALYYNIKKLDENSYLIFGYNGHSHYDHVKMVDVLVIDDKTVSLGSEIFEDKSEPGTYKNRISLRYSSDATVNLNYNPGLEMIVLDHLVAKMGKQAGQGPTMFPDGSYEGYELSEGKWKYVEKIYNHSYGENNAPRPKPVLGKKKDLFGN